MDGKAWTQTCPAAAPLQFKQYARVEGRVEHPRAVIKTVQAEVFDAKGVTRHPDRPL
jgi:hypothetical protein